MKKKTEEEIKERRRAYYQANKERIKEYERKKRERMSEDEKELERSKMRDWYKKKRESEGKEYGQKSNQKTKNKKIKLTKYPNGIFLLEYSIKKFNNKLYKSDDKYLDDRETSHLQKELATLIYKVDPSEKIVILESNSIQVYLKEDTHVEEISAIVEDFANKFIYENKNDKSEKKEKKVKHNIRPVYQYTLNGEFVAEYESGTAAAKAIGVSQASISLCCSGKLKKTGGYVFKYAYG